MRHDDDAFTGNKPTQITSSLLNKLQNISTELPMKLVAYNISRKRGALLAS
jgi:hypothetical protein